MVVLIPEISNVNWDPMENQTADQQTNLDLRWKFDEVNKSETAKVKLPAKYSQALSSHLVRKRPPTCPHSSLSRC
jgi:hypothetical protein